jgi:hypothetical protein
MDAADSWGRGPQSPLVKSVGTAVLGQTPGRGSFQARRDLVCHVADGVLALEQQKHRASW